MGMVRFSTKSFQFDNMIGRTYAKVIKDKWYNGRVYLRFDLGIEFTDQDEGGVIVQPTKPLMFKSDNGKLQHLEGSPITEARCEATDKSVDCVFAPAKGSYRICCGD